MIDLRPHLATVADGLDELVPALRDLAETTDSDAEREAFAEAARGSIRLGRQLRALTYFTRAGAGHAPVGARAPGGSRPPAQLAFVDETDDDRPTTS